MSSGKLPKLCPKSSKTEIKKAIALSFKNATTPAQRSFERNPEARSRILIQQVRSDRPRKY